MTKPGGSLAVTRRAIRQVPPEHLEMRAPDRDRSVRLLGFHIFRFSAAFPATRERGISLKSGGSKTRQLK